jgi:antitoxin component YwqK of YwqJK toxin-antitoxin module
MKYFVLFYSSLFLLLLVQPLHAQKKKKKDEAELLYLFKSDWSSAPDFELAAYFMQVVKDNDSTYLCRFYNKFGPMVKQESFKDEQLTIPNGPFLWYNKEGYLDSSGMVRDGHKDGYWSYYRGNKTYLSLVYKNGRVIEKKDYDADIYMDSTGAQSSLKEKFTTDSLYRDSLMRARDSTTPVQTEAKYKGNWGDYISKNLKTPERLVNVLGRGQHEVIVSFLVDKEGNVVEVTLLKSIEWSGDAEIFRVFNNAPKWIPAQQNGKPVIYRQKQKLSFDVD